MAIDALGEEPEVWEDDDEYGMGQRSEWCYFKKIIEKLPSAQPERKNGKWKLKQRRIVDDLRTTGYYLLTIYSCSECNAEVTCEMNYCPNCGSDMKNNKMIYPQVDGITPSVI